MNYQVSYSAKSLEDLKSLYEYIVFVLLAPDTAKKQAQRIMDNISSLSFMPQRYKIYEESPWDKMCLRCFRVDNYMIYYLIFSDIQMVYVVRVIYGGRDIRTQLQEIPIDDF